jgi:putative oxidoreductase
MVPLRGFPGLRVLPYHGVGCSLQRLFSTFPDGWPGFGLLLLRVGLSSRLIFIAISELSARPSEPIVLGPSLIAGAGGILLLAGLWTPITGVLVALNEVWIILSFQSPGPESTWTHICLAVISVSVAAIGPGAWSIDARLYGRRRFPTHRSRGNRLS